MRKKRMIAELKPSKEMLKRMGVFSASYKCYDVKVLTNVPNLIVIEEVGKAFGKLTKELRRRWNQKINPIPSFKSKHS